MLDLPFELDPNKPIIGNVRASTATAEKAEKAAVVMLVYC